MGCVPISGYVCVWVWVWVSLCLRNADETNGIFLFLAIWRRTGNLFLVCFLPFSQHSSRHKRIQIDPKSTVHSLHTCICVCVCVFLFRSIFRARSRAHAKLNANGLDLHCEADHFIVMASADKLQEFPSQLWNLIKFVRVRMDFFFPARSVPMRCGRDVVPFIICYTVMQSYIYSSSLLLLFFRSVLVFRLAFNIVDDE